MRSPLHAARLCALALLLLASAPPSAAQLQPGQPNPLELQYRSRTPALPIPAPHVPNAMPTYEPLQGLPTPPVVDPLLRDPFAEPTATPQAPWQETPPPLPFTLPPRREAGEEHSGTLWWTQLLPDVVRELWLSSGTADAAPSGAAAVDDAVPVAALADDGARATIGRSAVARSLGGSALRKTFAALAAGLAGLFLWRRRATPN